MHFSCGVIVPPNTTYDEASALVETAMAPYDEASGDDGWWDFWQIGGRFTGMLSEYDPTEDVRNIQTCFLCEGTGTRPDGLERFGAAWVKGVNGCNGCRGTGSCQKWPTDWAPFEGDVVPVTYALNVRVPYTVVTPEGVTGTFEYPEDEDKHERLVREALERYADQWLVVVDYHS